MNDLDSIFSSIDEINIVTEAEASTKQKRPMSADAKATITYYGVLAALAAALKISEKITKGIAIHKNGEAIGNIAEGDLRKIDKTVEICQETIKKFEKDAMLRRANKNTYKTLKVGLKKLQENREKIYKNSRPVPQAKDYKSFKQYHNDMKTMRNNDSAHKEMSKEFDKNPQKKRVIDAPKSSVIEVDESVEELFDYLEYACEGIDE